MEVTNYMTMRSGSSEPLAFWQQHSQHFPMLSKLAELYLSMSSASSGGYVLNNWSNFEWQTIYAGTRQTKQNFIHS